MVSLKPGKNDLRRLIFYRPLEAAWILVTNVTDSSFVRDLRKPQERFRLRTQVARVAAGGAGKLPQIESRCLFFVEPRDCHDTTGFVDDLALRAPGQLASYATIGGDHQRVICLVDQSHHTGGSQGDRKERGTGQQEGRT